MFVRTDVSEADQIEAAVSAAGAAFGGIDSAVNCAAVTLKRVRAPTAEVDIAVFYRIIAVELRRTFLSMKYELRRMAAQGYGSVVNISSGSGLVASKFNPSYIAAKHTVIGLAKAAAMDYAEAGIRVNVVAPGVTRTPMLDDVPADYLKEHRGWGSGAAPSVVRGRSEPPRGRHDGGAPGARRGQGLR